jgi:hypothetical protein
MTEQSFSLVVFPDVKVPEITITGKIARQNNTLTVHFSIKGETGAILLPESSTHPSRKDDLWQATCFEFFLAFLEEPAYWECNMSPSGDWNIYHMDQYRRVGFREETLIQRLPFSVRKEPGCILVEASVDINPIISRARTIQAGITSVIQTKDGHETYWALAHPCPQADFHSRESFTLLLAE